MTIKFWYISGYIDYPAIPQRNISRSWQGGHYVSFRWLDKPPMTDVQIRDSFGNLWHAKRLGGAAKAISIDGKFETILTAPEGAVIHRHRTLVGNEVGVQDDNDN